MTYDFFKCEESGFQHHHFAQCLDPDYKDMVRSTPEALIAKYEAGKYTDRCSDSRHQENAIFLACTWCLQGFPKGGAMLSPGKTRGCRVDVKPALPTRDNL